MATLNVTEIAQYHAQGYLVPGFQLPAARIDHLRATLDQLIRDNPGVRPEKLVSVHVVGQGKNGKNGDSGKNDEGVKGNRDFLDLAMEPEQPGQISMHDVYTIHGARVNHSARRRAGVALRYMPGTSVFERNLNPAGGKSGVSVAFATRPLWLLRGEDKTGRNDFKAGHATS